MERNSRYPSKRRRMRPDGVGSKGYCQDDNEGRDGRQGQCPRIRPSPVNSIDHLRPVVANLLDRCFARRLDAELGTRSFLDTRDQRIQLDLAGPRLDDRSRFPSVLICQKVTHACAAISNCREPAPAIS